MSLEDLIAQIDATQALKSATTDYLLRTFAALTHRIHVADDHARDYRGSDRNVLNARLQTVSDLRAQRDLIRAEILRRTGDL